MNPSSAEILYLQILRLITIVRLLTGLEHEVRTQYGFPVSERAQTLKPNQCATHSSNINAVGTDVVCPHTPQSHVCSGVAKGGGGRSKGTIVLSPRIVQKNGIQGT